MPTITAHDNLQIPGYKTHRCLMHLASECAREVSISSCHRATDRRYRRIDCALGGAQRGQCRERPITVVGGTSVDISPSISIFKSKLRTLYFSGSQVNVNKTPGWVFPRMKSVSYHSSITPILSQCVMQRFNMIMISVFSVHFT